MIEHFHQIAVSRVKEGTNLFFSTPLDENSLANVGKSEAFKSIHAAAKKAKEAALKKRRDGLQSNIGTRQDFIALLNFCILWRQNGEMKMTKRPSAFLKTQKTGKRVYPEYAEILLVFFFLE